MNNYYNYIMELIKKYFSNLDIKQLKTMSYMYCLYMFWNKKINLISKKSSYDFYKNHVLHSLSISKIINFKNGSYIMDIGTGGGFPGIPLSIIFPKSNFILVESINKKTNALKYIVKELKLNNIEIICNRVENINDKFDFIINRYVAKISKIILWTKNNFLSKSRDNQFSNGIFSLKGGNLTNEFIKVPKLMEFNLECYFNNILYKDKKLVYIPMIY